jgi:5S rRNA maturation endonuclease (ribonuclease M5)
MKTMNRSHLNDQAKLKIISDKVCDKIEDLLHMLGIEYRVNPKMISMSCPIHGGDNSSALNIYPEGDNYRGNWTCRTHGCEKVFKSSVIGFIRGVLSHQKYNWTKNGDDTCSFKEAVEFTTAFIKQDIKDIKISRSDTEKKNFSSIVHYINPSVEKNTKNGISREAVRKSLSIPAQYYIDRGYSKEILDKYDVGLCSNPNKEMYNRVVVPIYNNDHTHMIGCTGRSIFEKCHSCKGFHSSSSDCPNEENVWKYPKWKHNIDFKSQNHLYNLWFAKDYIIKTCTAIVVESPGNVWRLEENGIHNSVAIFGSSMSDRQKFYLDSSGAMNLVILTDNDEAGRSAAQKIKQKCQHSYRIYMPIISKPDIGEMTREEIEVEIKPILKGLYD